MGFAPDYSIIVYLITVYSIMVYLIIVYLIILYLPSNNCHYHPTFIANG